MVTKRPLAMLSDVAGWAFWQNMDDMGRSVADHYAPRHVVLSEVCRNGNRPTFTDRDVIFRCYHRDEGVWRLDDILPMDRTLGALRALWFWPEDKRPPGPAEYDLVNRYAGFQVVTAQNYRELADRCPRVRLLTNPVRVDRFRMTPVYGEVIASWNGNARHYNRKQEDVKGFNTIVQPACTAAGVPLVVAEYHTCRKSPEEMPGFYASASLAVVASLYEGSSNSFKEAMAAGLGVVTTDCGDAMETYLKQLQVYGESGIVIVERSVEAFIRALDRLRRDPAYVRQMGRINRQDVIDHWSWDAWRDRYLEFLALAR